MWYDHGPWRRHGYYHSSYRGFWFPWPLIGLILVFVLAFRFWWLIFAVMIGIWLLSRVMRALMSGRYWQQPYQQTIYQARADERHQHEWKKYGKVVDASPVYQAKSSEAPYRSYEQGYQAVQEREPEQNEYPSERVRVPYHRDEQPQAEYPQQMTPPM